MSTSAQNIGEIEHPTPIDVIASVASPNVVKSPVSGLMGAFIHLTLLERVTGDDGSANPIDNEIGSVVYGDLVMLEVASHCECIDIVVRRARVTFLTRESDALPLDRSIAELVPLFAKAGRGVLYYRERIIRNGERLRLRATVERAVHRVSKRLVVRDDLSPVMLDEVVVVFDSPV